MTKSTTSISFKEMQNVLYKLFLKYQFSDSKAQLMAKVFSKNSLDGVNSNGINRVPLFIKYVKEGVIKINNEAEKTETFGSIERWDGNYGPGIINATKCTS